MPPLPLLCPLEQLLEFMHQLPAFANMTMSVRKQLCAVMVFAVVERAGTIVLNDGEEVSLSSSQADLHLFTPSSFSSISCFFSALLNLNAWHASLWGLCGPSRRLQPRQTFFQRRSSSLGCWWRIQIHSALKKDPWIFPIHDFSLRESSKTLAGLCGLRLIPVSCLQLDSWSVILNGSVEVTYPDSRTEVLCMGNSFGVSPTMEKEYMKGVMKTKVDDCQVRCWVELPRLVQ